jgi:hypothetical protein
MSLIVDVSQTVATYPVTVNQSVSGIANCLAVSTDGQRLYAGTFAGVWRSDDGGRSWFALRLPRPRSGPVGVPVGRVFRTFMVLPSRQQTGTSFSPRARTI